MHCIYCGKALPDTATFCDGCGSAVSNNYQYAAPNPVSTPVSAQAQYSNYSQYPQYYQSAPSSLASQDYTKKAKTAFVLAVFGVVLAFLPLTRLIGLILSIVGLVMSKNIPNASAYADNTVVGALEAAKQRMKDAKVISVIGVVVGALAVLSALVVSLIGIFARAFLVEILEDLFWELMYAF